MITKIDVPYRINASLTFLSKITIDPGVVFEFAPDAGFLINANSKNASIIANGTPTDPIKFIGYLSGVKALWKGIELQGGNPETNFNYCIIDGAGSVNNSICTGSVKAAFSFGALYCLGNNVGRGTITNCTISNCGGYGVVLFTGNPVILDKNTFIGNIGADVYNLK